jgi:hypothetical protein
MKKWIVASALVLAVTGSGVAAYAVTTSGPSEAERQHAEALEALRKEVRDWKREKGIQESCEAWAGDLLAEAQELTGRIATGMYLADYVDGIADVRCHAASYPQRRFQSKYRMKGPYGP